MRLWRVKVDIRPLDAECLVLWSQTGEAARHDERREIRVIGADPLQDRCDFVVDGIDRNFTFLAARTGRDGRRDSIEANPF